jgi:4-amino-4-deoxy-L-arabinose transferase-like glycosyltransferase
VTAVATSTGEVEAPPSAAAGDDARFKRRVLAIGAVALIGRLVLQRFEPLPPPNADEIWYVRTARNLLHGRGFVEPVRHGHHAPIEWVQTALHAPLTVLLLVPATIVEPHGYAAQRATMALIGALTVVVLGYAARELCGDRVGIAAAVIAAVYAGLWVNDLVATSEAPASLLLAVLLLLALQYRRRPSTMRLVCMGAALGLLALDRAELALLGVLLVVPALVAFARRAGSSVRPLATSLALVGVLAVGVVVPWSAYNQVRFGRTVVISNNLGQTLVGANCDESYSGPLTGYDGRFCFLPALVHTPKGINEAAADAFYRSVAVTYALHHWHRWPIVGGMRELWLWSVWRPAWTVYMSGIFIGRPQWIAWTQIVSFWLLAPLAIYGFVVARRRKVRVAELVTMVAFTAALGLLVVGHLRYRVPAELAFVILAAVAVDQLLGRVAQPAVVSLGGGDDLGSGVADRIDPAQQERGQQRDEGEAG